MVKCSLPDILVKKRFAISLLLKPEKFQDNEWVTRRFLRYRRGLLFSIFHYRVFSGPQQ